MNKKIIGLLICLLMLSSIPLASGMQLDEDNEEPLGLFSRTHVKGIILGSRTEGRVTSFFAIRVTYTTNNLFGEDESGVIMFQKISFTGNFNGHLGRFYINGMFRGSI